MFRMDVWKFQADNRRVDRERRKELSVLELI